VDFEFDATTSRIDQAKHAIDFIEAQRR